MKILNLTFCGLIFLITLSCKAQINQEQAIVNDFSTKIIGTWIEEEDQNYKLIFLSNGLCKEYVNQQLVSTYNYIVSGNSCGQYNESDVVFLKWVDNEDSENYCMEILNVTDDALSLMIIDRGKRLFFNKQ